MDESESDLANCGYFSVDLETSGKYWGVITFGRLDEYGADGGAGLRTVRGYWIK